MKQLLILVSFLLSFSFSAHSAEQVLCMESGQNSAFIMAELTKGEVTLKHMNIDGSIKLEEKLKGSDPELSVMNATDEEGNSIIIINSITGDDKKGIKSRVLVCSK